MDEKNEYTSMERNTMPVFIIFYYVNVFKNLKVYTRKHGHH